MLETYNIYLNAINEADIETINDCVAYPLAYIGAGSVKMLDEFPIDPREWKKKTGWVTSNAFEIYLSLFPKRKLIFSCVILED